MKIAQTKVALRITAMIMIGGSAYAFSRVMSFAGHPVPRFSTVTKPPGHVLQQVAGRTLTATQIADRCHEAYSALRSYQGTTTVNAQGEDMESSIAREYHTSADVKFLRPGKISVTGQAMRGNALAYVSNGIETEQNLPTIFFNNRWEKVRDLEAAVSGMTGIGFSAPTTIPGMLIGMKWGMPVPLTQKPDPAVREDQADGQSCYVLTARATYSSPAMVITQIVWIDEKTFRLRRTVSDRSVGPQTTQLNGEPHLVPAGRLHLDQSFTDERTNQPIPDSTFALPAVQ